MRYHRWRWWADVLWLEATRHSAHAGHSTHATRATRAHADRASHVAHVAPRTQYVDPKGADAWVQPGHKRVQPQAIGFRQTRQPVHQTAVRPVMEALWRFGHVQRRGPSFSAHC